ncbi:double-strand break repair protein MRE11 [Brachypodium distachyon]|uniref:double-strand break repair protein MRE11 n=1 Tax=Brachypodium distachyon TaxID=15368 RepID=UPI000D0D19EA|nr:double-strand break repair protein MRE11 [Brachypodium distachyon]|eukprot:XP_024317518.1 double-strand break repair protein MRE11 [Brachypodium distachyon]
MEAEGVGGESSKLRILVATDCHLGYLEKDELRRSDSFDTFEEILSLAKQHKVDFLLLGGNLFHESKPSRLTMVKTMEILRQRCFDDRPVRFQVVSDQAASLHSRFRRVNFEDPNLKVGLPVFTIHGDHDEPIGVDNVSPIDILSASGLVNYFGKVDLGSSGTGQISLHPVLIKKGATSVALYGLGNVRDARLSRMFQTPDAVRWMQPEDLEDMPLSEWFNIFVLHQNRTKASPDNGINERLLPCFLDLVIWGHEHECLVDPEEVPGMGFHITQPGSSVATSLTSAEAKQKHVLLLEIKGMKYRPAKIPLKTVRPFEYAKVVLEDQADVNLYDEASVLAHLDKVVGNLIEKNNRTTGDGSAPKLPLVRIKVDYSGFSTINPQQFGQKYVGKVANPQDIIVFSRSAKRHQNTRDNTDGSEDLYPNGLDPHMVEAQLAESNLKMQILSPCDLNTALHVFVNKDDGKAFHSCLQKNVEEAKNKLTAGAVDFKIEDEEEMLHELGQCMQAAAAGATETAEESSQNLIAVAASTGAPPLSAFEELKCSSSDQDRDAHGESDELVEAISDDGEIGDRRRLASGKRPAGASWGASPAASSSWRRKTDLQASFRRIPPAAAKEDEEEDGGAKKSGRPDPHVPWRYGAVRKRS